MDTVQITNAAYQLESLAKAKGWLETYADRIDFKVELTFAHAVTGANEVQQILREFLKDHKAKLVDELQAVINNELYANAKKLRSLVLEESNDAYAYAYDFVVKDGTNAPS